MKPGAAERSYLNSALHAALHRHVLPGMFQGLKPLPPQANVLEIGCGNGIGAEAIVKQWRAAHVTATDIDDTSLSRTQFYLDSKLAPHQFAVRQADILALPFAAQRFDAVVSHGVIHHVEDWKAALAEVARVVKPGGLFYAWEFYRPLLEFAPFAKLFPHPANRFTHQEFLSELARHKLAVLNYRTFMGLSGMVVAQRSTPTTEYYD
ncbi:MAG: class I SAM-dependent methyltransferase [Pseudomonadaceae bacterium]|nr:class I SAM-dependent methyltransferase [Pseudomonadaceae bacterium]